MRICRAHNLAQQHQRGVSEIVFCQNRIERNIFAMMAELAVRNVEDDSVIDSCPVGVPRQEQKFRVDIDKFFNEPWAGHTIDLNFLASDPFHALTFRFVAAWFWYAVLAAVLYGAHQIFTRLAAERIGEGLGGFIVEVTAALSILVYTLRNLVRRPLESEIQRARVQLLAAHWNLRWRRHEIAFFLLFQKGQPALFCPSNSCCGAVLMAISGILFFHESPSWQRLLGIVLAIAGLFLLRR